MGLFKAIATPSMSFDWPRNYDEDFLSKTADIYELQIKYNPELGPAHMPSLYAAMPINFNISIIGIDNSVTVTHVNLSNPPDDKNITVTPVSQTNFTATGSVSSLSGENFRLKLLDNTFITLPMLTEEFDAPSSVVKWSLPDQPWSKPITYEFGVTYIYETPGGTIIQDATSDFVVTQYIYWDYEISLQSLELLVERSQW